MRVGLAGSCGICRVLAVNLKMQNGSIGGWKYGSREVMKEDFLIGKKEPPVRAVQAWGTSGLKTLGYPVRKGSLA
jgi:hypothetical protein